MRVGAAAGVTVAKLAESTAFGVEQIQAAACGKTASQGGLNVPDVKKILAAPSVQPILNSLHLEATGNASQLRESLNAVLHSIEDAQGVSTTRDGVKSKTKSSAENAATMTPSGKPIVSSSVGGLCASALLIGSDQRAPIPNPDEHVKVGLDCRAAHLRDGNALPGVHKDLVDVHHTLAQLGIDDIEASCGLNGRQNITKDYFLGKLKELFAKKTPVLITSRRHWPCVRDACTRGCAWARVRVDGRVCV